jgi:hypothetical protein
MYMGRLAFCVSEAGGGDGGSGGGAVCAAVCDSATKMLVSIFLPRIFYNGSRDDRSKAN